MSKSNNLVKEVSTNVNVGMDEVVSIFVSRYETSLYNKKDDLSDKIKTIKGEIKDQQERLERNVDKSQYTIQNIALNISSTVENIDINWKEGHIEVNVNIKDSDDTARFRNSFNKIFQIELDKSEVNTHKQLEDELKNLNNELMEVMGLIKSVSRKERQIRGKISEMKLKESGLSSLLENDDMTKLIQLD